MSFPPLSPPIGAGSFLGMSTLEDAKNELATAQAAQQRASQFFCPNWTGFKDWSAALQDATDRLSKEAAAINGHNVFLPDSVAPYDDSTISQINLDLISLNAQAQTNASQCKAVPSTPSPSTPGQTPGQTPGGNGNQPAAFDPVPMLIIAGGVGAIALFGYWYMKGR